MYDWKTECRKLFTDDETSKEGKVLPEFKQRSLNVKEPRITCLLSSQNRINF